MEKTYYLISCEEREENNIGVIADARDLKGKLKVALEFYFDDGSIEVVDIQKVGKDYEKKFIADCFNDEGIFEVQLESTILFD